MTLARRICLISLLCGWGCHTWQPVSVPGPDQAINGTPEMVRVTRKADCGATAGPDCTAARRIIRLYNPRVAGDSLIGFYDRANRERVTIAVGEVIGIESREIDPYKTTGAAIGIGLVVAAAAFATVAFLISSIDY